MSTGKLTNTTFIAGANDQLAVVDVYEQASSAIQNSYHKAFHDVSTVLDQFLGKSNPLKNGLDKLGGSIKDLQNALNKTNPLNQLKGTLGGFNNLFNNSQQSLSSILNTANLNHALRNLGLDNNNLGSLLNNTNRLGEFVQRDLVRQLNDAINSYGSLNPLANSLTESIEQNLNEFCGGDISAITNLLKPPIRRIETLNTEKPLAEDRQSFLESINDPVLANDIQNLSEEAQSVFVNAFKPYEVYNDRVEQRGQTVQQLDPQLSQQNAQVISKMINRVTNSETPEKLRTDLNSQMITSLTTLASKSGFPEVFQSLSKDVNEITLHTSAKALLQNACEEGDFAMIKDVCQTKAKEKALEQIPELIENTVLTIKRPENLTQQEYSRYYQEVKETFEKIDPNWQQTQVGENTCIKAYNVCFNPFFCDLLQAKLNDVYSEITSEQIAYPLTGVDDPKRWLNEDEQQTSESQSVELDYSHETFLLLSKVFLMHDVSSLIQRDFPLMWLSMSYLNQ